jgi:carbamoyltransferase
MKGSASPVLLGFYLGLHDSNMCAWIDGALKFRKFERNSGIKHQRATMEDVVATCHEWGISPDHVAFSDGDRNGLGSCRIDELSRLVPALPAWTKAKQTYCLDHHFAHMLSAAGQAPVGALRGVAIDGRGDNGVRARVMSLDGAASADIYHSTEFTVGRFFNRVGVLLGLSGNDVDLAGKVMGAQALGRVDESFVDTFAGDDPETLPGRLLHDIPWRGRKLASDPDFFSMANPSFLDWLASAHLVLEQAIVRFFDNLGSGAGPLIYVGGCAQNSIFNETLYRRHPGLIIPPHAYDGGLSVGCVEFLRRSLALPPPRWPGFPFVQDDEDAGYASAATSLRVAELLAEGCIVGWMQGRGEIGPRALGHRSILLDPRRSDGKDLLNNRVKRREAWRPYAASVLAGETPDWFDTPDDSPFMLRAIRTRPERAEAIPAVVHDDLTCRIQTVGEKEPELRSFSAVLHRFNEATGVPLVLNTSMNGGGEPIHGYASQACQLLESGHLDVLCVGDRLIFA